ncbi:hypothetical protein, partial [Klebsiella aerogenes]|uniref:hypothetical protein n=1 Tax=Klebsiella aerogenes TaxID=548 RepID=UPI0019544705
SSTFQRLFSHGFPRSIFGVGPSLPRRLGPGRLAVWLPGFSFAMTFKDDGGKRLRAQTVMQMN